jgi:hypothetical protein
LFIAQIFGLFPDRSRCGAIIEIRQLSRIGESYFPAARGHDEKYEKGEMKEDGSRSGKEGQSSLHMNASTLA